MKRFGVFFTLVFLCSAAAHGFVYETFMATESQIRRVKTLGESEPAQLVFPRTSGQYALALHDGQVYWSTFRAIHRGSMDGSSWETVLSGIVNRPMGLTIDPGAGKMYWHDSDTFDYVPQRRIYRANLDGSAVEVVVESDFINGMALDLERGKLYWIFGNHQNDHLVMRANLDGTNPENITPANMPDWTELYYYPAVTVGDNALYFSGTMSLYLLYSKIYKMNLDGTGLQELPSPYCIVVDLLFNRNDGMLYGHASNFDSVGFQIVYRSAPGDESAETLLTAGPDIESDLNTFYGGNIAVQHQGDQTILWFADGAGIKKKRVPSVELLATSIKYIQDIAFVPAGGIYWSAYANLGTGTISRVETRDSEPEILLSGLNSVCGLAVDLDKGFLYWCDPWVFSIYRSSLAGEDVTSVVSGLTRVGMARGLVLDAQREILYWADTTNKAVKYYDLKYAHLGRGVPHHVES